MDTGVVVGINTGQGTPGQGNFPPSLMDLCFPCGQQSVLTFSWRDPSHRGVIAGTLPALKSKFFTGQMLPPLSSLSGASPSPIQREWHHRDAGARGGSLGAVASWLLILMGICLEQTKEFLLFP